MSNPALENVNIKSIRTLATPAELRAQIPETPAAVRTVQAGRTAIERILDRDDPRLVAIVGPCSVHSLEGAIEYARRLRALKRLLQRGALDDHELRGCGLVEIKDFLLAFLKDWIGTVEERGVGAEVDAEGARADRKQEQ